MAVIGLLKAHSQEIQMCSHFIYGRGSPKWEECTESVFKMKDGSTKYSKETVLFDKDQRELLEA